MKTPPQKIALWLTIIALGAFVISAALIGNKGAWELPTAQGAQTINQSASIDAPGARPLTISTTSADIIIEQGTSPGIEARFTGEVSGYPEESLPRLETQETERGITITIKRPAIFGMRTERGLKLTVSVPQAYEGNISASSISGDIHVPEIITLEQASTTSGDIDVAKGHDARITSISGDITAQDLRGESEVETTSGDIRIQAMNGSLQAKSISGDVTATYAQATGENTLRSTSGDITITVPATTQAAVELKTTSGRIRPSAPLTIEDLEENSITGTIGTPAGTSITASTISGDITLQAS